MTYAEFIINLSKSKGKKRDAYKNVHNFLRLSGYFWEDPKNLKKSYLWRVSLDIAKIVISILEDLGYGIITITQNKQILLIKIFLYKRKNSAIIDENFIFANIFNAYIYLIKPKLSKNINPKSFVPNLENSYHIQIYNIHNEKLIYRLQRMISKDELLVSKYIRDDIVKLFNSEDVKAGNIFINYRFNKEDIIDKEELNVQYHKITTCLTIDIQICSLFESLQRMTKELELNESWLSKCKRFLKIS